MALRPIAEDLGSSSVQLQWVINGFNAALAVFTLIWGPLALRAGYRFTFLYATSPGADGEMFVRHLLRQVEVGLPARADKRISWCWRDKGSA